MGLVKALLEVAVATKESKKKQEASVPIGETDPCGPDGRVTASAKLKMYHKLKNLGFIQFEAYLLGRTGVSLAAMAKELEYSVAYFEAYHNAYLAEHGYASLSPLNK
jgi:hypothetical protein